MIKLNNINRRVFDCFSFFNELDVLKIRLNELNEVVDHFVLIESVLTHTCQPKPLFFDLNKEQFSPYLDKIKHVILTEKELRNVIKTIWPIENFQRNYLLNVLKELNANDDDIVIMSDCDEIVKNASLQDIQLNNGIISAELRQFQLYLNYEGLNCPSEDKLLCKIMTYSQLKEFVKSDSPPSQLRYFKTKQIIKNAGWHFSFLNSDVNELKYKLKSYAHEEHSKVLDNFPQFVIIDRVVKNQDIYGNKKNFNKVKINETWPIYVRQNLQYFEEKNLILK